MRSWHCPDLPSLPGQGTIPVVWDTVTSSYVPSARPAHDDATLFVCGITPYDATHLGHAATYIAFDLLVRAWLDAGRVVRYAQCVTEVDDPLLERAASTGQDWRELAASQIELYRRDMEALSVVPPTWYRGVEEQIPAIVRAVATMEEAGQAYRVPLAAHDDGPRVGGVGAGGRGVGGVGARGVGRAGDADSARGAGCGEVGVGARGVGGEADADSARGAGCGEVGAGVGGVGCCEGDVYADLSCDPRFGEVAGFDRGVMLSLFAERGGDPDRPGKRDSLDPLLWRAARPGEPAWQSPLGPGRPGWHIECAVIVHGCCGVPVDVQGGGADLLFPHHEMSTSHMRCLAGTRGGADVVGAQVHAGLISLGGEKMSKSLGNLVLVRGLIDSGVEPAAIRLALLSEHYRADRDWSDDLLLAAQARLARWREGLGHEARGVSGGRVSGGGGPDGQVSGGAARGAGEIAAAKEESPRAYLVVERMRRALALDLDAPSALAAVDGFLGEGDTDGSSARLVVDAISALLGVSL